MKKLLFVLVDGVGDVSLPSKSFKTPLQLAHLPHLDSLASIYTQSNPKKISILLKNVNV